MKVYPYPEPIRVLQIYSPEAQAQWVHTTPLERLKWLDFALQAAWAGAAYRTKDFNLACLPRVGKITRRQRRRS